MQGINAGEKMRFHLRFIFLKAWFTNKYFNPEEAADILRNASSGVDTIKYKYEWVRIMTKLYEIDDSISNLIKLDFFLRALDYSESIHDIYLQSELMLDLGNIMYDIGEDGQALTFYQGSDSLRSLSGYGNCSQGSLINQAIILGRTGFPQKSDSILLKYFYDPDVRKDTSLLAVIPISHYNHRSYDGSLYNINVVKEAYSLIKDKPRFLKLRGLYRALIADHYAQTMELDSLRIYSEMAMNDLPNSPHFGDKARIWFVRGLHYVVEEKYDSALYCRVVYEIYLDSLNNKKQAIQLLNFSAKEVLRHKEEQYRIKILQRNWIIGVICMVVLLLIPLLALIYNRRNLLVKEKNIRRELELEKAKRKLTATTLTLEEKDSVLDGLRSELREMRKEGDIPEGSARRLESTIKAHLSGHEQDEKFQEMFDTINPGFTGRLREISPDLADSYIKLACYTLMELDNKKIASLMMIKPESVHQARWRLRQRLRIPEGTTLEDFLRALNSGKA